MSTPPNTVFRPQSRLELITGTVMANLGAPTLPVELNINTTVDIPLALVEYYKYIPIKSAMTYTIRDTRELDVPHSEILAHYDPAHPDLYFYVGVIHQAMRHQIGQNAFNQNLLGLNVGVPIADPMENLQMATMIDISTGDVYYEDDEPNQQVRFVVGGSGNLSVVFGLGCWDLERVPWKHIRAVSDLVAIQYYSRLIAVRETGSFPGSDFRLSAEFLKKSREEAVARSTEYLTNAAYMAITVG